jgi:hypothetical protein
MRITNFSRYALVISAVLAMLEGCGKRANSTGDIFGL